MRARNPFWLWLWMMYTVIAMGMLPACSAVIEHSEPIIVLDPTTGGSETPVAVSGTGFPAETQLNVRLGPPSVGATPQSYGDATTDIDGRFTLSFVMPIYWPDGTPITETDLVVVVLNADGSIRADAPFRYIPSHTGAPVSLADASEAQRQVVLAWRRESDSSGFCGDAVVHESGYVEITLCNEDLPLQRRLLSEDAVRRLRIWQQTYQSFEVEQAVGSGPNRVLTRLTFAGEGPRKVSDAEVQVIQALLERLVDLQ